MAVIDRMQQQGGAPPPAQGAGGAAPGGQGAPADDRMAEGGDEAQQDAQIDSFLDLAYRMIYDRGEANEDITDMLRTGTTPADAVDVLAEIAAQVGARVVREGLDTGQPFDSTGVVLPATLSLVQDIGGIAEAEQIYDYSPDEMNSALMKTGEKLFEATQDLGIWSQQELEQGVREMMQMNQSGELDHLMRAQEKRQAADAEAPPAQGMPAQGMPA